MGKVRQRVGTNDEGPGAGQADATPGPAGQAGRKRKPRSDDFQLPSLLIHLEACTEATTSFSNAVAPFKASLAAYGQALKDAQTEEEASKAFDQYLAPNLLRLRDCLNSVERTRNLLPSAAGEISHSRMALHRKQQIHSEDLMGPWGGGNPWEPRALPAPPLNPPAFQPGYGSAPQGAYGTSAPGYQLPNRPFPQPQALPAPQHQRFLEAPQAYPTISRPPPPTRPNLNPPGPPMAELFEEFDPLEPLETFSDFVHSFTNPEELPSGAPPSSLKPLTAPLTVGSYELPTQEEFASWQKTIETLLDMVFAHLVSVLIVNRNPSCDHSHSTNKNNIKRFASSLLRYLHPKERYEAVRYARGLEERGELRVVLSSLLEQIRALGIQIMTMPDNPGVHQETQLVNEFARLFPYIIDPLTYLSTLKQSVALGINLFSANVTDFQQYLTLIKEQPTVHHACFRFRANHTIEFIAPPNLRAIQLKTFRTPVNIYRYWEGSYLFCDADEPNVLLPPVNAL